MLRALIVFSLAGFGAGCDGLIGGDGLTESDVESIEPGNANGVVFSGTWKLETEVTQSTCAGVVGLPGIGDRDEEEISFAQQGGELTRLFDDVLIYTFRGAVNADGTFQYGQFYDLSDGLPVEARYIELVQGKFELANGGVGRMEGTAERRYQSSIFDCSAELRVTGSRTGLLPEGS